METDGAAWFGCMVILRMHRLVNVLPDSHSWATRHKHRVAVLMDTCHMIASDVLLQGNKIFRSAVAVLLFFIYFIVSCFSVVLSFLC